MSGSILYVSDSAVDYDLKTGAAAVANECGGRAFLVFATLKGSR